MLEQLLLCISNESFKFASSHTFYIAELHSNYFCSRETELVRNANTRQQWRVLCVQVVDVKRVVDDDCTTPTFFLRSTTMAVAASSSPITQVSQNAPAITASLQPQLLTRLNLELRGERFSVDRETIMNLPESVLLCLFPNGLVLSRQSAALSDGGENEEDEEVYSIDVCR